MSAAGASMVGCGSRHAAAAHADRIHPFPDDIPELTSFAPSPLLP